MCRTPVSYTHLDVYKRQSELCSVVISEYQQKQSARLSSLRCRLQLNATKHYTYYVHCLMCYLFTQGLDAVILYVQNVITRITITNNGCS